MYHALSYEFYSPRTLAGHVKNHRQDVGAIGVLWELLRQI